MDIISIAILIVIIILIILVISGVGFYFYINNPEESADEEPVNSFPDPITLKTDDECLDELINYWDVPASEKVKYKIINNNPCEWKYIYQPVVKPKTECEKDPNSVACRRLTCLKTLPNDREYKFTNLQNDAVWTDDSKSRFRCLYEIPNCGSKFAINPDNNPERPGNWKTINHMN